MSADPTANRDLMISVMRIAAFDASKGVCTATLRSGVQLTGRVKTEWSKGESLFLNTKRGWHTIDYAEVAAISGEPSDA